MMSSNFYAIAYLLCGVVYGANLVVRRFSGGAKAEFFQALREKVPGAAAMPWGLICASAALGIILIVIVWPWYLVTDLRRLFRRNNSPAAHPTVVKLVRQLRHREDEYEQVFAELGLAEILAAIHAIDMNKVGPVGKSYSYVELVAAAAFYCEWLRYHGAGRKAEARVATRRGQERWPDGTMTMPAYCVGIFIAGRVFGRLGADDLTEARVWYAQHLKEEFNSGDHVHTVFAPIASVRGVEATTA